MSEYAAKFKDPRWQKKRLRILNRDDWTCQGCFDKSVTLNVHHRFYIKGKDPWDYPDHLLVTLCSTCHDEEKGEMEVSLALIGYRVESLFLAREIDEIATGFQNLEFAGSSSVVARAIRWMLSDEDIQREMVGRYLQHIKEPNGATSGKV